MSIDAGGEHSGASRLDRADNAPGRESGRALITIDHVAAGPKGIGSGFRPSQAVIVATIAVVLGGGFMAGSAIFGAQTKHTANVAQVVPAPPDPAALMQKVQDEVHTLKVSVDSMRAANENPRQDDAIRSLKKSVDVLKQDLEVAKASNASAVAQLGSKLDRLDRDPSLKLAEISARLDRLDRTSDKEPNPKLADIAARLDQLKTDSSSSKLAEITARLERIEKQVSSPTPIGSMLPPQRPASASASQSAAPVSVQAAADVDPKAAAKPATIDGWMLRDVYGGVALLEGRAGLREVSAGQFLPGVGEIRSIERRGRSWVVVTSRGLIEADNRW